MRYHFANCPSDTVELTDDQGCVRTFRTKGPDATDELRALLKRVPESTKRRMLSELDGQMSLPDPDSAPDEYRACTWDQLREVAENGVSIGAHTVSHPILSRLETGSELQREIAESKLELQTQLQRPVESFAYPNGLREDIGQAAIDCVRRHFKVAVTAVAGLNAPGADPHQLLRLPCEAGDAIPQFARLLAGPLPLQRAHQSFATASH